MACAYYRSVFRYSGIMIKEYLYILARRACKQDKCQMVMRVLGAVAKVYTYDLLRCINHAQTQIIRTGVANGSKTAF